MDKKQTIEAVFTIKLKSIERQIIKLFNHKDMSDDFKKNALSELKEIIKNYNHGKPNRSN